MHNALKKYILPISLLAFFAATLVFVASCKKDDDDESLIVLNSFGPSPALRGGDIRFIGKNLDQVSAIILSDGVEVSSFKSKSATEIVLTVPTATVNGLIRLKTPQGDIVSKTPLTISEPIAITSFSPAKVRPGAVLTIEGTYLNLIKEVIFANKKAVAAANFVSQSQTKIEVKMPVDAQTGTVVGGLGGAAVGGIVGHQSGRGLEGALIGGGVGALAGNAIGNSQDQRNYQNSQRQRYYDSRTGRYYYR